MLCYFRLTSTIFSMPFKFHIVKRLNEKNEFIPFQIRSLWTCVCATFFPSLSSSSIFAYFLWLFELPPFQPKPPSSSTSLESVISSGAHLVLVPQIRSFFWIYFVVLPCPFSISIHSFVFTLCTTGKLNQTQICRNFNWNRLFFVTLFIIILILFSFPVCFFGFFPFSFFLFFCFLVFLSNSLSIFNDKFPAMYLWHDVFGSRYCVCKELKLKENISQKSIQKIWGMESACFWIHTFW